MTAENALMLCSMTQRQRLKSEPLGKDMYPEYGGCPSGCCG